MGYSKYLVLLLTGCGGAIHPTCTQEYRDTINRFSLYSYHSYHSGSIIEEYKGTWVRNDDIIEWDGRTIIPRTTYVMTISDYLQEDTSRFTLWANICTNGFNTKTLELTIKVGDYEY
jgi:hypothetical protein